jgi:hypothetical protein
MDPHDDLESIASRWAGCFDNHRQVVSSLAYGGPVVLFFQEFRVCAPFLCLRQPGCDLLFALEPELDRFRCRMQPGGRRCLHPLDGEVCADFDKLLNPDSSGSAIAACERRTAWGGVRSTVQLAALRSGGLWRGRRRDGFGTGVPLSRGGGGPAGSS